MTAPLLQIEDLRTHFFTRSGTVKAVDGVSLEVKPGEVVGLVGESGSGKTVLGFSVLGLVDPPGRVVSGRILFKGEDLAAASRERRRRIRGRHIAAVFQDPMMTLNPVLKIGTQMIEAIRAHVAVDRAEARRRACEALQRVGIASPAERLDAYPNQFSGGMRQRVAIAIALLHQPDLIIADEPTTALDVTIQGQILYEVQKMARDTGTAIIWITHDLSVVAGLAETLCVMYAGRIVEQGSIDDLLDRPRHPYTRGLIGSMPDQNRRGEPLRQIPGMTPSLAKLPEGCPFRPRCERADTACLELPELDPVAPGHRVRCRHPHDGGSPLP